MPENQSQIDKHLTIIETIAAQQNEWSDWLSSMKERNLENKELRQKSQLRRIKKEWQEKAQASFEQLLKEYAQGKPFNGTHAFQNKFDWKNTDHPIRQLQERYLRLKLDINQGGSSLENWAAIGIALANKETNLMEIINPPRRKEIRGRPRSASIDYERAVWKYSIDNHILETASKAYKLGEEFLPRIYSVSTLLNAFFFGLDNPQLHNHKHILEHLEGKLKLRGKSRASLLVGFNRGEKQRETLWDD